MNAERSCVEVWVKQKRSSQNMKIIVSRKGTANEKVAYETLGQDERAEKALLDQHVLKCLKRTSVFKALNVLCSHTLYT